MRGSHCHGVGLVLGSAVAEAISAFQRKRHSGWLSEYVQRQRLDPAEYCSGRGKADCGDFVAQVVQRVEIFTFVWALPEPVTVFLLQLAQLWRLLLVRIELTLRIGQKRVDGFTEHLGDVELQLV